MAISPIATASTDASTGTAVSLTHGFTIAAGDVVIVSINANGSGNTVSDNNGSDAFTSRTYADSPDSARAYVFDRVCDGGEDSAFDFTLGSSGRWSIVARQYRGVHADIWDVAPAAGSLATGDVDPTAVAPSITIATEGACRLIIMADDRAPTTTTYSSNDGGFGNVKSEEGQQYQVTMDKGGATTGATGTVTVTSSADVTYVIWQCALKPTAGTAYTSSPSGGITPAGAMTKRPAKIPTGSITPSATITRQPRKALAGALTPAATLAKRLARALSGELTPAATLSAVRSMLRAVSGALTPTGDMTRQTRKPVADSVTPAATLARQLARALSGEVTPAATLTAIRAYLRTLLAELTPAGALIRQTAKTLAGGLTPSAALAAILTALTTGLRALTLAARSVALTLYTRSRALHLTARSTDFTLPDP